MIGHQYVADNWSEAILNPAMSVIRVDVTAERKKRRAAELSKVEVGKWFVFKTAFEDNYLRTVCGRVTEIEKDSVIIHRMHDAIPGLRLRLEYIRSCREMTETEVLVECI